MAKKPKDPFARVLAEVVSTLSSWQARLFELWKVTFKSIAAKLKPALKFIARLIKDAAKIAVAVGRSSVERVINAGDNILSALSRIPVLLRAAIRLGKTLLSLIRKSTDPKRLVSTLKRLATRYVNMVREISSHISELVRHLNVLADALAVINKLRIVLKVLFSWTAEVTSIAETIKKVARRLSKMGKAVTREAKQVGNIIKLIIQLRPDDSIFENHGQSGQMGVRG